MLPDLTANTVVDFFLLTQWQHVPKHFKRKVLDIMFMTKHKMIARYDG